MFGEKLKALRDRRGMTQQVAADGITEIANGFTVSQRYLSVLEHRESVPRGEVLQVLSAYYRVPMSYWYEDVESETNNADVIAYLVSLRTYAPSDHRRFASVISETDVVTWQPDDDLLDSD